MKKMKIKELKDLMKDLPDDAEVLVKDYDQDFYTVPEAKSQVAIYNKQYGSFYIDVGETLAPAETAVDALVFEI